nr:MAG TPA: hypothetical protein [Caudoviricetes sp.]
MDYKIKVEILNTQLYRSRTQIANGVPKSMPLTRKGEGENIVYSYAISIRQIIY